MNVVLEESLIEARGKNGLYEDVHSLAAPRADVEEKAKWAEGQCRKHRTKGGVKEECYICPAPRADELRTDEVK